jgi:putative membrane protein
VNIHSLPALNACLNTSSTAFLLAGYYFIRNGNRRAHRVMMLTALVCSALFLTSYLVYHAHVGSVRFTGEGTVRAVYFTILISHTILAVVLPILAGVTLFRALRERFDRHRAIARWTLPVWLYVSVTGVVIYVMLYQWYPPA